MNMTSAKLKAWIDDRLNQTFVATLLAGLGATYFIVGMGLRW
ncbi:hypothetical protein [Methylobacterium oxalidis]|uniref:Uncharacterized protein n=1 Tax=Methylobacterium oxalidis TaxID=944322 RepID=A0A512JDG1_9HYPH|nr:hypothetical protein [Methylobacterium oxalidis]GEP07976.1 hypothetical protein MOX02_60140 [Methylobacterium oxalidis]GJE35295.1 hypothetical protein LDDCCGHA_5513 [Methylobacterium oxalidis]